MLYDLIAAVIDATTRTTVVAGIAFGASLIAIALVLHIDTSALLGVVLFIEFVAAILAVTER